MDKKKEFSVESELRVEEQLRELCEKYGAENIKQTFLKLIPNLIADKAESGNHEKELTEKKPDSAIQQATPVVKEIKKIEPKPRPNVKNFEQYVLGLRHIQQDPNAQISKPIVDYLNSFLNNAKKIFDGKNKEVNEVFYMSLASKTNFDLKNKDEEWIIYNLEIIVKLLKNKLRRVGYEFLDNDVEVGQLFNSKIHTCMKYEYTDEKITDGRIIRVVDEGIIIEGIIHINANVVVGKCR